MSLIERSPGQRPRVLLHYAQTLDGRIATRTGSSQWISGPAALRFAHELRAAHDAVLVGIGTVLQDNPRLTVRLAEGPDPLKVVVDSKLRTPASSALLRETPTRTVVLTTPAAPELDRAALRALGARVEVVQADARGQVDLASGLSRLMELGISSVMVEGGAEIVTSLLRERLADRLAVCVAPILLGRGIEAVGDLGIGQLAHALGLCRVDVRRLGDDLILSGDLAAERLPPPVETAALPVVRLVAQATLPTVYAEFEMRVYDVAGAEVTALLLGDLGGDPPLVRLHSECLTGEVFGSLRCDCGQQLSAALEVIATGGRGCLVYLRQEGRGIGLANKIRAYGLQDGGLDTLQANLALGLPADAREYRAAAAVLREMGLSELRLLTNNPAKIAGLESAGLKVVERVAQRPTLNPVNLPYLRTKAERMGHLLEL